MSPHDPSDLPRADDETQPIQAVGAADPHPGPALPPRSESRPGPGPLEATDAWFLANGLSYFVPEKRVEARRALRSRRTWGLLLGLVVLLATVAGTGLAFLSEQVSTAPAVIVSAALVAAAWYALTVLHARPIVSWALIRALGTVWSLLPMMTRALPLLLIFVTFLFINAEVWQLAASLAPGTLWLVCLLFAGLAVAFLLVRLPEEVDTIDDEVDDRFLRRACRGTPLEAECARLIAEPGSDPASRATVTGFERWNLVLVLVVIQTVQLVLLAGTVFVFFLVFGVLAVGQDVQEAWTGGLSSVGGWGSVTPALGQVSLFLAAFSLLYLTVSTVTDETYRKQFFGSVMRELERAVGVRAVYLTLRAAEPPSPDADDDTDHRPAD